MGEYKQVILVRKDLKLSKGKLSSQVSHASVEATLKSDTNKVKSWRGKGMKKVILKVDNEKELLKYKRFADELGLVNALIRDAGKTELKPGTVTCLGIGPDLISEVDKVSKDLKMV
jgi:peptidyl-tRNA hydrolase, PTH2 family